VVELVEESAAFERIDAQAIVALTEAATAATFYRDDLSPAQIAANRRIVEISAPTCLAAAGNAHQSFGAAFVGSDFAGYVISTRHAEDDLELDWMMVHPRFHGSPVSAALMAAGMDWLGRDRPIWLNVIAHNARAIRFYRRFGFEIDPQAVTNHVVPHAIMRRKGGA
jgi:ribosomal protein S18 acetylase RimI-like enzyme